MVICCCLVTSVVMGSKWPTIHGSFIIPHNKNPFEYGSQKRGGAAAGSRRRRFHEISLPLPSLSSSQQPHCRKNLDSFWFQKIITSPPRHAHHNPHEESREPNGVNLLGNDGDDDGDDAKNSIHGMDHDRESQLPLQQQQQQPYKEESYPLILPRHVAFVCDGNSRWATARNLPRVMGHQAGAHGLQKLVESLLLLQDIHYVTLYGFSTENWKRPQQEIDHVFAVMEQTARQYLSTYTTRTTTSSSSSSQQQQSSQQQDNHRHRHRRGLRFLILGDLDDPRIPTGLRNVLQELVLQSNRPADAAAAKKENARLNHNNNDDDADDEEEVSLTLCLAINYGGRQDIVQATRKLVQQALVLQSQKSVSNAKDDFDEFNIDSFLTEDSFAAALHTAGIPDVDLLIRTSGECRLSNFLLWNTAYAELYFTDTVWPDFDDACLQRALTWYATRQRRFGGRQEQEEQQKGQGQTTKSSSKSTTTTTNNNNNNGDYSFDKTKKNDNARIGTVKRQK